MYSRRFIRFLDFDDDSVKSFIDCIYKYKYKYK